MALAKAPIDTKGLSSSSSMPSNMRHGDFQVFKKKWAGDQMSSGAYVDQAAEWSRELTRMRARGPGDLENAMRQIEREYGVDYWTLWRLRYRKSSIRDIGTSVFFRLQAAWEAERQRQLRRLQHDIETTKAIAGPSHAAVVAAEAVLGTKDGED